jgi:ribosomal protein S18 acetylase RimI-like enzyme
MKIEKTKLTEELEDLMEEEYAKEERKHNVFCNYTPFCFVASEDNNTLGIIAGYTAYEEVYIDDLIVIDKYRGRDIGTKLVTQVEDFYRGKGFNNINLCTNGFQAPKFYEKCGYQLEFIRKNKNNPKLDKYFYVKFYE